MFIAKFIIDNESPLSLSQEVREIKEKHFHYLCTIFLIGLNLSFISILVTNSSRYINESERVSHVNFLLSSLHPVYEALGGMIESETDALIARLSFFVCPHCTVERLR